MRHAVHYIRKHPWLTLLVLSGLVFHLIILFPSGSDYCYGNQCGLFFWGPHGHDGIWHLALHAAAFNNLPFSVPIFSGIPLAGYNFLLDIIIFLLSKIGIPPIVSYFKLLPLIWFALFTWMVMLVTGKMKKSALFTGTLLFLSYFGGSLSYLFTLWHTGTVWGSSSLLSMQAGQTLTNPQFALSLVCLLAILYYCLDETLSLRKSLILGALVFLILGLKFYGGLVAAFILAWYYLSQLRRHPIPALCLSAIGPAAGAALAYILFYHSSSGSGFVFSPFAMVHSMIEDPQLFYLKDMVNARYFLQEHGWSPRLVYIEAVSTALFLVFNFGLRITGVVYSLIRAVMGKMRRFEWSIVCAVVFACAMTIAFIQRGVWWNTIQFFYYALFLSNLLMAGLVDDLHRKWKPAAMGLLLLLVAATVPYNADLLHEYLTFPAPAYISREEHNALSFLGKQEPGTVLASSYTKNRRSGRAAPFPLYSYDDTSYVPAFSGMPVYYADTVQLSLLGIPFEERQKQVESLDCAMLSDISYVYEVKAYPFAASLKTCGAGMKRIFSNREAVIYSITK